MDPKRKKQLIIIYAFIIALSLFLVSYVAYEVFNYYEFKQGSEEIVTTFNEIYESSEKEVVLFAAPYCKFCQKFKPVLTEIADENNFKFYYFDTSAVFDSEMQKIIDKIGLNLNGIPHLAVIDSKKVIAEQSGNVSKEQTIEFLKEAGIIKEEES